MIDLVLLWIEIELRTNRLFLWQWPRIFGAESPRCISFMLHGRLQSSKSIGFFLGVNRQLVTWTRALTTACEWVTTWRAFVIDNIDKRFVAIGLDKPRFTLNQDYLFLLFMIQWDCSFQFFLMRWCCLFLLFLILWEWNLPITKTFFTLLWWTFFVIDLAFKRVK